MEAIVLEKYRLFEKMGRTQPQWLQNSSYSIRFNYYALLLIDFIILFNTFCDFFKKATKIHKKTLTHCFVRFPGVPWGVPGSPSVSSQKVRRRLEKVREGWRRFEKVRESREE